MEQEVTIREDDAKQVVRDLGIPPCPEILTRLLAEMRKEEPDYRTVSNIVSEDVSLAAAMLKTVNSAFFALRNKATSVRQALALLGLRNVKEIVTGLLLRNSLMKADSKVLERFWETSSDIAQTASLLAKSLAGLDREDVYTFALFRDRGIPLMVLRFPEYEDFYSKAVADTQLLTEAENAQFGIDHARVGAELARSWHLPDETCNSIAMSHDYSKLTGDEIPVRERKLIALGLVAEYIYSRCNSDEAGQDWAIGGNDAIAALGIDEDAIEDQVQMVEGILAL
ncbi:MAG: HDOD domain-containing protein [Betaproteobacteria bacterium]|nr:MAG: HDOD domain-containing protein [Betaproteobacteria bacterium]